MCGRYTFGSPDRVLYLGCAVRTVKPIDIESELHSTMCSIAMVMSGGVADAVSLQDMLEGKLETYSGDLRRAAVEMAQSWRKDPTLAKLQAMVIAFNDKDLLLISGNGEVLEPDEDVVAIGSGGNFAQAAAIAMTRHSNGMSASEIAKEAVKIASGIDVFTDDHITTDEI